MDLWFLGSSVLCSILVIILSAVVRYVYGAPPSWEKCGVPSHPKLSFFETLRVIFARRAVHEVDLARQKFHTSKIYGVREASLDLLTISDLDILKKILITDFWTFSHRTVFDSADPIFELMLTELDGGEWKRLRNILTPAFSPSKLKMMVSEILKSVDILVQDLTAAEDKPIDTTKCAESFIMDVIGTTAFGIDRTSYMVMKDEFIRHAKKIFGVTFSWRFAVHMLVPKLANFLGISFLDCSASKFFKNETLKLIDARKTTELKRIDFLQNLVDIANETERREEGKKQDQEKLDKAEMDSPPLEGTSSTKSLTKDEMISQCVMFFMAALGTTSSTITFACFALATHQEIQQRVKEEVDEISGNKELSYDAIQNMKYLDKVISETLRKYPQAVRVVRTANQDYKLGDTTYTAYKGTMINVPIYAIHHDENHFPNPGTFDPERFSSREIGSRNSFAYLAFGAGPRNCIGKRLALLEVKICIAAIIRNFSIEICSETKDPPEVFCGYGLLTPKNVMLKFVKRKDKGTAPPAETSEAERKVESK